MEKLISRLETSFSKLDAKTLLNIPQRVIRERAFLKDRVNNHGETWRRLGAFWEEMGYGEEEQIARQIRKAKKLHDARNKRVAKKLHDAGINDIELDAEFVMGDNFEGTWFVDNFLVSLKVVYAGGYNLQCLHPRVLVKVKEVA